MAAKRKAAPAKSTPKRAVAKSAPHSASQAAPHSASDAKSAGDLVDEQLARYRSMRDFAVTREPSGSAADSGDKASAHLPFVIQKHAATRLHYDFRLGWNGVLKSWAVAKGPSYFTKDKRLAVEVEDHPMEYGGFEGIIPKGQYGGGTVMLWDTGTWEPQAGHTDVDAGLRDGSLKFTMHGTKLKGKWALVRMGGRAANESKPNWLLIKEHDEFERGASDAAITEEEPDSVLTGRSLEGIASGEDHVWNSKETAGSGQAWHRNPDGPKDEALSQDLDASEPAHSAKSRHGKSSRTLKSLRGYPEEALPEFIPPQLALQTDAATDREGWLHELKLDGYRIEARKDGAHVKLFTRSGLDWTHRMKEIAAEVAALPVESAILDGEVVVLSENGTTSFADLQAAFREGAKHTLTYFVFDLLHMDGHNLREAELVERKKLLATMLAGAKDAEGLVRLSEHIETRGVAVFEHACQLDAEGIISKRASSRYTSGRSGDWVKVKCVHDQEFVIGGFTLPSNGIHGVGALLLGYYNDGGALVYAGRTGTGFNQKSHKLIRDQLEKLRVKAMPFAEMPGAAKRGAIWVKPELVAQVNFATWTADHLLRQAAFKGLREDKAAKDVRREEPAAVDGHEGEDAHQLKDDEAKVDEAKVDQAKDDQDGVDTEAAVKRQGATTGNRKAAASQGERAPQAAKIEHAAVRLTHPDKVLDLESGLTKQQLADYYWAIAEHILPQIADRPLSLVRCPEGSTKPCFFQKHTNHTLPPGISSIDVPDKKTGVAEPYITLSTREALAGLAQMGVLEVHPWGSKNGDLEHPDRIIIDLDPDEAIPWATLAASADEVRQLLKKLGLESFLKSTGGKGLHVVLPIEPRHDWAVIKQFAHAIALHMEKQQPKLYLSKMSKAARKGRIYVDYLRNERGATSVAAFSPRARAGAPVSVPLDWAELKGSDRPVFYVAGFGEWKSRLDRDPWETMAKSKQKIDPEKVGGVLDF